MDDLISRQAALDLLLYVDTSDNYEFERIEREIKELPSVQSEMNVLEKIRAEIFELWQNEPRTIEHGCLNEILEIIDKYKTESEDTE